MNSITDLVAFAQEYLKRQPFDIVHDLEHHQLVYNNCLAIIDQENVNPNRDVITVSAWWHDVDKSYKTANSFDNTIVFFKKTATDLQIDPSFTEQCVQVINQHSFSQSQTTLESKILFDADKIEYVNIDRIQKFIDHVVENPQLHTQQFYHDTYTIWMERVAVVESKMHFTYSKKIFRSNLEGTRAILDRFREVTSKFR